MKRGRQPSQSVVPRLPNSLDCSVADMVNSLHLGMHVARVDAHFTRAQRDAMESLSARYSLALGGGRETGKTVTGSGQCRMRGSSKK